MTFSTALEKHVISKVIQPNIVYCEFKWLYNVTLESVLLMLSTKEEKHLQIDFSKDIWFY